MGFFGLVIFLGGLRYCCLVWFGFLVWVLFRVFEVFWGFFGCLGFFLADHILKKSDNHKWHLARIWNDHALFHAIYYNSPTAMGFVLLCPHPELWLLFQHTFVILYPWAEELKPLAHQNSLRQLEQWFLRHTHPPHSWPALPVVSAGSGKKEKEGTETCIDFHLEPQADLIQFNRNSLLISTTPGSNIQKVLFNWRWLVKNYCQKVFGGKNE